VANKKISRLDGMAASEDIALKTYHTRINTLVSKGYDVVIKLSMIVIKT